MRFRAISPDSTLSMATTATDSAIGQHYTFGNLLSTRIAKYGVSSFKRNLPRSRASLKLTLSYLTHPTYRQLLLHPTLHSKDYGLPDPNLRPALFI